MKIKGLKMTNNIQLPKEVQEFIAWNGITVDSEEGHVSFFPFFICRKTNEQSVEIKSLSELKEWEREVIKWPKDSNRLFTIEEVKMAYIDGYANGFGTAQRSDKYSCDFDMWLKFEHKIEL
jgi:hypothetical protein